jgi:hypothetical protein
MPLEEVCGLDPIEENKTKKICLTTFQCESNLPKTTNFSDQSGTRNKTKQSKTFPRFEAKFPSNQAEEANFP